jgi:hypothetical protein
MSRMQYKYDRLPCDSKRCFHVEGVGVGGGGIAGVVGVVGVVGRRGAGGAAEVRRGARTLRH